MGLIVGHKVPQKATIDTVDHQNSAHTKVSMQNPLHAPVLSLTLANDIYPQGTMARG